MTEPVDHDVAGFESRRTTWRACATPELDATLRAGNLPHGIRLSADGARVCSAGKRDACDSDRHAHKQGHR